MFIISNYRKDKPFTVGSKNNLVTIETTINNISYLSTESNSPVQYFCVEDGQEGVVRTREMRASKFFTVETSYEKPSVEKQECSLQNLIYDFGDKNSKKRVKRRDIDIYVSTQTAKFNVENQLLPEFDREAEDPRDAYSIELMFDEEMLRRFRDAEIDFDDLCRVAKSNNFDQERREYYLSLDCLYKVLVGRNVQEKLIEPYKFFLKEIRDHIKKGRLSSLMRDKLMVKFYILLLMVNNYELELDQIPKFGEIRSKIIGMLRAIGCNVAKNGKVKLSNLPKGTFRTK